MENKFYCYICGSEITDANKTDEHIVLNAIGGHLHSFTIMCNNCNNRIGGAADAKLAEDLSFFTDMLKVKKNRQNQHNQVMTDEDDHAIIVDDAGKSLELRRPYITIDKKQNETTVHLVARNQKELDSILRGLVRKGEIRQEDADAISAKASVTEHHSPLNKTNCISVEAFPSIIKSATNYYVEITRDANRIKHLVPYIEGQGDCKDVLYLHHFKELPYSTTKGQVTHMIHIEGSKDTGLLYAMMEYYSIYVYIVVLDKTYNGDDINLTYAYDVVSASEIERDFSCKLSLKDLEIFRNQPHSEYLTYLPYIQERANDVMKIWEAQSDKEMLHEIIDKTLGKYPEGCVITAEIIQEVEDEVMNFFEQKIIHSFHSKKP